MRARIPQAVCRPTARIAPSSVLALAAPSSTSELYTMPRTALRSNSAHPERYQLRPARPAAEDLSKGCAVSAAPTLAHRPRFGTLPLRTLSPSRWVPRRWADS